MSILSKSGVGLRYKIDIEWQDKSLSSFVRAVSFSNSSAVKPFSFYTPIGGSYMPPVFHEDPGDLFAAPGADQIKLFILLNDSIQPFVDYALKCSDPAFLKHTMVARHTLVAQAEMIDNRESRRKVILHNLQICGVDKDKGMIEASIDFMSSQI